LMMAMRKGRTMEDEAQTQWAAANRAWVGAVPRGAGGSMKGLTGGGEGRGVFWTGESLKENPGGATLARMGGETKKCDIGVYGKERRSRGRSVSVVRH